MKFNLPSVRTAFAETAAVCARFPYPVIVAFVGTAVAVGSIEAEDLFQLNVLYAAAVGLPFMLTLKIVRERHRSAPGPAIAFELAGFLVVAAYAFTFPSDFRGYPPVYLVRFIPLWIGLHFAVAFAPCLTGADEWDYWQFNRRLFQRFALAALYSAVLYIGLSLALVSLQELFGLHISFKRHAQLWAIMAGLFNTLFFLAGVPRPAEAADRTFPKGLKAFAQFALAPLVAVFVVILYLYMIRMILARSWLNAWVEKPVYFLAAVGILAALLLQPDRESESERWARWYWKHFFRALAPVALLLVLSMGHRIASNGLSELRYYGAVLAVWLLCVALWFSIRPRASTRCIPGSLAIILIASAAGPWSATSLSYASRADRLMGLLAKAGALQEGRLVKPAVPMPPADVERVQAIVRDFVWMYGRESLDALVKPPAPENRPVAAARRVQEKSADAESQAAVDEFGLVLQTPADATGPHRFDGAFQVHLRPESLPVEGFRRLYTLTVPAFGRPESAGGLVFRLIGGTGEVSVAFDGTPVDAAPLNALLKAIADAGQKGSYGLPYERMSTSLSLGSREWRVVVVEARCNIFRSSRRVVFLKVNVLEK